MPTYVYQCRRCGRSEEAFQRMADAPLKVCPACGGDLDRRISGGTGFITKAPSSIERHEAPRCGASSPCCGREERCERPPCS